MCAGKFAKASLLAKSKAIQAPAPASAAANTTAVLQPQTESKGGHVPSCMMHRGAHASRAPCLSALMVSLTVVCLQHYEVHLVCFRSNQYGCHLTLLTAWTEAMLMAAQAQSSPHLYHPPAQAFYRLHLRAACQPSPTMRASLGKAFHCPSCSLLFCQRTLPRSVGCNSPAGCCCCLRSHCRSPWLLSRCGLLIR